MASPLHDNPKSPKGEKPKDAPEKKPAPKPDEKDAGEKKMADKAKAAPDADEPKKGGYLGGDSEPGEGSAKREVEDAASAGMSPKDKFMEGMKGIQKRHESERRDFHGNHREALRQMAGRHGKEIADHFDMSMPAESEAAPAATDGGGEE